MAVVAFVTACGSGDDDATTAATRATAAPTTTAATEATEPPTTTAGSSTTPPATTAPTTAPPTTAAPTTTSDPLTDARERAEALSGSFVGTWTNTTFGSTGPIVVDIAVEGDAVVIDIDIGGFVFGQSDPEPANYRIPLSDLGDTATIETEVFGTIGVVVDPATGTITASADAVPAAGIATFEATVTPTGDGGFSGTYVIGFDGGDGAEGTLEYGRE